MIVKLRAIVLGHIKYGDSSSIIKAYTSEGLKSFIAGGVRTKKGPLHTAMLMPLTCLNVVCYDSNKSALKRVKEAQMVNPYRELHFNPIKSCLSLFLAEMLQHCLKEEETNPALFEFLQNSFEALDAMQVEVGNFHLKFLMRLTVFLGFAPEGSNANQPYFDLQNGVYCSIAPVHAFFLDVNETMLWKNLYQSTFENEITLILNRAKRQRLLQRLLDYYKLHLNDFGKLRTVEVLQTILD